MGNRSPTVPIPTRIIFHVKSWLLLLYVALVDIYQCCPCVRSDAEC